MDLYLRNLPREERRQCRVRKRVHEAAKRGTPTSNQQLPEWNTGQYGDPVRGSQKKLFQLPITCSPAPRISRLISLQQGSCQSEVGASGDPVRGDPEVADQSEVSHKQRHQSEVDCSAVLDHYLVLQSLSVRDRAVDAACEVESFRDAISAYQQPVLMRNCNLGADFWCEKWKTQVCKDGTSQDFTTCKRSNSLTVCLHRSGTHHLPTYREQVQLRASFNFPALSTRNMTMQYAHGV